MSKSIDIVIRVLDNGLRAQVHIPAGVDAANLNPALLRMIAGAAHVQITPDVERRLIAIVEDFKAAPRDLTADFAHATGAVHGAAGSWAWEPKFNPDAAPPVVKVDAAQHADYYASRIVSVASGTIVARITPPTNGADGRSVTGAVLPALRGRQPRLRAGEGLQVLPDGAVVATADGVLRLAGDAVAVSPILDIRGCVDFATGQIDFKGDVRVADAVRDGFEVRATGDVTIGGPVEGAVIVCLGNLICPRGIASARRARIVVERDSQIAFLRNVCGLFRGSLTCRGEIEHSDITVGGELHGESGRVMGGRLVLTGTAHIGSLGSPDWLPTSVSVGDLPLVAIELRRLTSEAVRHQKAAAAKEELMGQLMSCGGGKSASAREQLTELQYELSELHREAAEIETKRAALEETIRQGRAAELHVARIVYPRVRIQCGQAAFEIEKEIKGPLRFMLDERGTIRVRISSQSARPITDFAHAVPAAPAHAPATAPAAAPDPLRKCA